MWIRQLKIAPILSNKLRHKLEALCNAQGICKYKWWHLRKTVAALCPFLPDMTVSATCPFQTGDDQSGDALQAAPGVR